MISILNGILLWFISTNAFSCAVCGFGDDGSQFAFLLSTAMLSLVPLIMFSLIGIYFYSKFRSNSKSGKL